MAVARTFAKVVKLGLLSWLGLSTACGELNVEDFDEEAVACEEAVAHLESCCGSLDGHVSCRHVPAEYSSDENHLLSEGTYPDIGMKASGCYRALSCAQIRARRDCDAYRGLTPHAEPPCP